MTAQEEYGLRCLLQLARGEGAGPVSIATIAQREGLGPEYVAKLLGVLRGAGLVASTRGARGGYHLTRPAVEITVWEAIDALGGRVFPESYCGAHSGKLPVCAHVRGCAMRPLWQWIDTTLERGMSAITLADLLHRRGSLEPEMSAGAELGLQERR